MKSFVVDFMLMSRYREQGFEPEEMNKDVFDNAIDFMRTMAEEDSIGDFEDVYPTLVDNEFGAEFVFNCPVTEETKQAYACLLYTSDAADE